MLKVGDVFYGVISFLGYREKVYKIIDGEKWYKYNDSTNFKIETYVVKGMLRKYLEGEWEKGCEYDMETEFFLEIYIDDEFAETYTGTLDSLKYFLDKEEALEYIKNQQKHIT
jgi:hypothetical protein